ncbi:Hsp20/alpha crystallin family protein [Candidatus Mcinerneyibacteriota bacterium]|nr:Hsp20/alpha crystallin family protein [Candidatus Mcinerneyibacteriota bacterium]
MTVIALNRCYPGIREKEAEIEAVVGQTDEGFEVRAALPGVDKEKITLFVDSGRLVIKALRESSFAQGREIRRELAQGEMKKEYYLPESVDVDNVSARFENGILSVRLPLRQQSGPRAVSIE